MGGHLALRAAVAGGGGLVAGAVLLAPMLSLNKLSKKGLNPLLR